MWGKPAFLNAAANATYAVAVVLVLYAAAVYLARLPAFSLREVRVDGELKHVTRGEVETIVRRELKGGFFTVNLAATRAAFERLPWVRGASVRRQWPARLDVALEEHVPFARWAGQSRLPGAVNPVALVNTHGEVFHAAHEGDLPVFIGPEGAAREMAIQYRYFHRALGTIGETPVQVRVTTRRAWQIKLASGPVLELGRESIEARLHRFVALHDRTVGRLGQAVDTVDLRYANGFAVRIPELRHEKFEPKRGRRAG